MKTAIVNGDVVVWKNQRQSIMRKANLIFENDRIIDIIPSGQQIGDVFDDVIDASGMLVCPGFINTHTHGTVQIEGIYSLDWSRRDLFSYNYLATQPIEGRRPKYTVEEARILSLNFLVKILKMGSTTIVEMGASGTYADVFAELAGEVGIRAYTALGFRSAELQFDKQDRLQYAWDEEKGLRDFDSAMKHFHKYDNTYDGRIKGFIEPRNADTCTPELLKAAMMAANELNAPLEIHTAQSLFEFQEIVRRTGKTPVQFLHSVGLLSPRTILGHCVFTTGHSQVAWPGDEDQRLLAETGTSIAHSPSIFNRDGTSFESFSRYRKYGVNVSIATDMFPEDMINEMRVASNMSKLVEKDYSAGTAWEVFEAATVGGAKALNRDDLGKLMPGAKADIVLVDLANILIGPYADPVKILVHTANGRDVDTVIVDGRVVVRNKKIQMLDIDEKEVLAKGQAIAERLWTEHEFPMKETAGATNQ